jgi:hypothetical protein
MAEDKKGFLLYADLSMVVAGLTDKEAGMLFKHILLYVNDLEPKIDNRIVNLAFAPIKQQLKRDLAKFEKIKQRRAELGKIGGLKSGEVRRSKMNQLLQETKQNEPIGSNGEANEAESVNENENVNESVINNTNVIYLERESKISFLVGSQKYQGKPSELVKQFYKMYFDSRIINSGITPSKFYEEFDKEFIGKHFTNERHVQNAIASTIKNLSNPNRERFTTKPAATNAIESAKIKDFTNSEL